MAKFGEGDARWIVSDRKDGVNVNSWHWQEKDALPWARQRLKELLGSRNICMMAPMKLDLVTRNAAR